MSVPWAPGVRYLIALAASIAVVATSASAQPTPATGEAMFVVAGGGWGPGVGMPQYGAMGQANEGRTYQQILAYYYSGTKLGTASSRWLRVLLAEGRGSVKLGSEGPFTIQGAVGPRHRIEGGELELGTTLRFKGPNGPVGSVWIDLTEPTYGIHGTPDPELIGKVGSHGCVRLTNWDAEELAGMVKPGVIVKFID